MAQTQGDFINNFNGLLRISAIFYMQNPLHIGWDHIFRSKFGEILLVESHKLDLRPFRWGIQDQKWEIKAKATWLHFVGKSIGLDQKKKSSWFGEPRCKLTGPNSRIQFASNEWKLVPKDLNPGPHLKVGP